jgi:hypothetical protein
MLTESSGIASAVAVENKRGFSPSYLTLVALFSLETVVINLARLPESMRFDRFAFCDHGANLTLQFLIANGLRPSIDFGYHYGLLPALVGRIWFAMFGATPWAYQAAMIIADLLCAWAIAKILTHLKIGTVGLALAIITLGYSFQASYVNFAHATEAVLLSHALAEQVRGSRANALALTTAAVFAKPSMGYVYGLLLVILILRDFRRSGFCTRRLLSTFAPAAIVFVVLGSVVSIAYGPLTFLQTVVPLEGVANYRALNFGLMRAGRSLWDPNLIPWFGYYVFNVNGLWIVSTIFLCGAGLFQLCRELPTGVFSPRGEALMTCATLHVAFLLLFFGNQWSWIYYSYFLMIGTTIAVAQLNAGKRGFGLGLCMLAILSWTCVGRWSQQWWKNTAPDPATAGLWAPAAEKAEWLQVLSAARGQRTVILASMGGAELISPGFEEPVNLYLIAGLMAPDDIHRKLDQLSSAQIVVVPTIKMATCSGIPDAPEFRKALKDFDLAWRGQHFEVFQRRNLP